MKHLPNLYPLRFILSIFVVIFHLPGLCKTLGMPYFNASPVFNKGSLAVLYFFSLSGFLILRLIYNELKATDGFNFKEFYSRRIKRLYPLYYLVLLIGLSLYHFVLPLLGIPFDTDYNVFHLILSYVFIIPNVFTHYHPEVGIILLIAWSIGVEEQFYLFIPVFMYLFKKKVLLSVAVLLALLLILLVVYPATFLYNNFYFYFLFGGLLSMLSSDQKIKIFDNKVVHIVVYALFILSFFTDWFHFENNIAFHVFNLIVSGLTISLASDYPIYIIRSKVLDHLGKISYGIYMLHMVVITGLLFVIGKLRPYDYMNSAVFIVILNIVALLLTIGVAHVSYEYFESRFYKEKKRAN